MRLNERGEVLAALSGEPDVPVATVVWRREAMTRVSPTGVVAFGTDLSNRGHVVGAEQPNHLLPLFHPFAWSGRGGWQVLTSDPIWGVAADVNDRGQVWGFIYSRSSAGDETTFEAAAWHRGELMRAPAGTVLHPDGLPGLSSRARGNRLNGRGQVAFDVAVGGERHAAVWHIGRRVVDLGTLGGGSSSAAAINEAGDVVGWSLTADGERHAVLWRDGEIVDLGTLGGSSSEAVGVNDRGEVIGTSLTADGARHGFVWRDGNMTQLDSLAGGCCSEPADINNRGQVVGSSGTADGRSHAVLWHGRRVIDLGGMLDAGSSEAIDINDRGQVLGGEGEAVTPGGDYPSRAVLWSTSGA